MGQLKTVKLYRADEPNTPEWTLLYVHRSFRTWAPDAVQGLVCQPPPLPAEAQGSYLVTMSPMGTSTIDAESRWFLQNAIHAIYVYRGDGHVPAIQPNQWTLPADAFVYEDEATGTTYTSLDSQDEPAWTEAKIQQHLMWSVPSNWRYRLRFTYDETIRPVSGCSPPAEYWRMDAQGNICCIPDSSSSGCLEPADTGPSQHTVFGTSNLPQVPGIFQWGTPLVTEGVGGQDERIRPRVTPCLLRVEKTERPDNESETTAYTGYLYATSLDEPTRLLDAQHGSGDHPAVLLDGCNLLLGDHTAERVTPKLKHILRDDRLRAAMKANGSDSINSVFDPAEEPPRNRRCYADVANLTLDWQDLSQGPGGRGGTSVWVRDGLIGQCVLSQVEYERLFVRDAAFTALVGRVRINDGKRSDGIYDLMYMGVVPSGVTEPLGSGGGLRRQGNTWISDLPDTYTLFPFSWRRQALNDVAPEFTLEETSPTGEQVLRSSLAEPSFITLVDRHDGGCSGQGDRSQRAPYMIRHLYNTDDDDSSMGIDAGGAQMHIMLPHQRQVVGLNPAGFVLFERSWDYQADGLDAFGPTEQFEYEQTISFTGQGPVHNPISDNDVEVGLRLRQHCTLGWGVGYIYDMQNGLVSSGGCDPPCITPGAGCLSQTRGLITTYEYHDYNHAVPDSIHQRRFVQSGLVKGTSVKEGLGGSERKLSDVFYDENLQVSQRSWYVIKADEPVETMKVERCVKYHEPDPSDPVGTNRRIRLETTWQAAAAAWPGGPALIPFESRHYSETGFLNARSYGLCTTIMDGVPGTGVGASIFVDVYGYDKDGRRVIEVVDAAVSSGTDRTEVASAIVRPEWASLAGRMPTVQEVTGFLDTASEHVQRHVPAGVQHLLQPLNRTTAYSYGEDGGLEIVSKPGGRYDFHVLRDVEVTGLASPLEAQAYESARVFTTYVDVTASAASSSSFDWRSTKAGQVATVLSGQPMRTWSVEWVTDLGPSLTIADGVPSFVISGNLEAPVEMFKTAADDDITALATPAFVNHIPFKTIAAVRPVYDAAGRVTEVSAVGLSDAQRNIPQTEVIEHTATFTDFGLVSKQIEPSLTLRRTVSTPLGQVIAEFKGTHDEASCWQGDAGPQENMALTARHIYGIGINNIRQLVLTRRYRNFVGCSETDYHGRGGTAFASDQSGWEEAYGYDRRGRRCAMEVYGEPLADQAVGLQSRPHPDHQSPTSANFGEAEVAAGAPPLLRAEYTWYDHQSRVRFTAAFAPVAAEALRGTTIDPRVRDVYTEDDPTAQEILAAGPVRLTEYVYDNRGQQGETIEYDTQDSAGLGTLAHQSTRMYYDHHGRVTHRISSTGRWERSTYDALGRLISTSTLRGEMNGVPGENAYEIERTDNAYHENGQVERSSRLVRINIEPDPEGVAPLIAGSGGNAVRTDTLTWYDESGRVIFTASLGTDWFEATASDERPNGIFANASATPPPGPTAQGSPFAHPPEWNASTKEWTATWMSGPAARVAHITQTVYDDTGRVAETRGPDGVRTVNRYDGLNRKVMEIVYPADADGNLSAAQGTAYQYREGKLVRIGALRPGHLTNEAPLPRFGNPSDQSIQITELVYGDSQAGANGTSARIVDASSGVPIVYNPNGTGSGTIAQDYDLLRGIKFAKGGCACDFNNVGGITVQDLFDFLAAHVSGNLSADFNGNGVVTVQDIFDFLACYFAGAEDCGRILAASANDGLDIQFEYTLDGMIYSRSDLTRIAGSADPVVRKLAFSYDHLGRRIGVEVKSGAPNIADAVERTHYFFDSLDRLIKATAEARDHAGNCYYPVATSTFTHDSFGNLLSEKLLHGGAADTLVSALQYQWAYTITAQGPPLTAGDGPVLVPRLTGMTLPWASGNDGLDSAHRGRVAYGYGQPFTTPSDSSWLDGSLNRVRTIDWHTGQGAGAPTLPIARYDYAGASMRAGVTLGPGTIPGTQFDAIVQDFAHGNAEIPGLGGRPALAGLDRFGRTRDLSYLTGVTLNNADARARQQLRYDDRRGGLLIGERLTQRQSTGGGGGGTTGADRSWTYGYDGFGRLQTAARGTLSGEWTFDATDRRNLQQDWTLDDLGNWNGGPPAQAAPGLHERRFDAQGVLSSLEARRHATDARNQIIHQSYTPFDPSTTPPTALERVDVKYAYDPSGRMIYDGRVIYDHDAFGRVVQIREVLKELTFDSSGAIAVPDTADTGRLIAHYSYDALGRVIRTQRPVGSASGSTGERLAITDLYYDGVRVVQEVGWASVPGLPVPVTPGGTAYLPRPARHIAGDGELATLPSGLAGEVCSPPTPAIGWNWPDRRLEREYLWHADPGAYVDECAAQLVYTEAHEWNGIDESGDDTTATVLYTLSDHNATLMGVTDELGRVVAQYGYTPYGDLLAAELFSNGSDSLAIESLAAARGNRLGHQGLRTERFDRPWDGPLDIASAVTGGTGATGRYRSVCHNRNRLYDPAEGRFTGVDPNGLGVPVLGGLAFGGMAIGAGDVAPDLMGHYGDGMNAHVAYGAMPRGARDPSGLSWVEDYADVILPLVPGLAYGVDPDEVISTLSRFIPFDPVNTLNSMLEGFQFIRDTQQYIQDLAFQAEEQLEWATDWDASDDANPLFGTSYRSASLNLAGASTDSGSSAPAFTLGKSLRGGWAPRVSLGRAAEAAAGRKFGGVKCKRMVLGKWGNQKPLRRFYDREGSGVSGRGHMMEVKGGSQTLTERVRRQIRKDQRLIASNKVRSVKWVFFKRDKDKISDDLLHELNSHGIDYEIIHWNRR